MRVGKTNIPTKACSDDVDQNINVSSSTTDSSQFEEREEEEEEGVNAETNKTENLVVNYRTSAKKTRPELKGASRQALLDDMEFSLLKSLNDRIWNKRKPDDAEVNDPDEIFCKSLAVDLKELPPYEKCMAKNEMRMVLYKYQMSLLSRQHMVNPNQHFGQTNHDLMPQPQHFIAHPSIPGMFSSPPSTPGIFETNWKKTTVVYYLLLYFIIDYETTVNKVCIV